jgi:hypothetical protein
MKILVFCQRKKSFDTNDNYKVEYVVKNLESFVIKNYDSEVFDFEYLTNGKYNVDSSLYEADYKFFFNMFDKDITIQEKTKDFIESHNEYYDMIMLQTCPLLLITNQLPYLFKTLKMNGILLFTNFSYHKEDTEKKVVGVLTRENIYPFVGNILEKQFLQTDKYFTEYIKIKRDDLIIS